VWGYNPCADLSAAMQQSFLTFGRPYPTHPSTSLSMNRHAAFKTHPSLPVLSMNGHADFNPPPALPLPRLSFVGCLTLDEHSVCNTKPEHIGFLTKVQEGGASMNMMSYINGTGRQGGDQADSFWTRQAGWITVGSQIAGLCVVCAVFKMRPCRRHLKVC
jgi:hypothetical protein